MVSGLEGRDERHGAGVPIVHLVRGLLVVVDHPQDLPALLTRGLFVQRAPDGLDEERNVLIISSNRPLTAFDSLEIFPTSM